jgi:hypothetical protein
MTDFTAVETAMQDVCNYAVDSLGRFSHLTDLGPQSMHESFMASFVFDRLGEKRSMAPELMVSTIWKWKHYHTQPVPPLPSGIKPQQRVDLTLFAPPEAPNHNHHPWCFIEFKRNWNVETDYWKLKSFTKLLECPCGFASGILRDTEANTRQWLGDEARTLGERFVVSRQWNDSRQCPFVVAGWLFASDAS